MSDPDLPIRPIRRLVFAGEALVDLVMRIPALPERGGDMIATSAGPAVGGGFNIMAAAARHGLPVLYAGGHGSGPWGDLVRSALAAEGIAVLRPPDRRSDTGFDVALVERGGERTFVTSLGAETLREPGSWDAVPAGTGDAVYISGYGLASAASGPVLGEWAASLPRGVLLFADPGPLIAEIPAAVLGPVRARCDWWSCNQREAWASTGAADPAEAARQLLSQAGGADHGRRDSPPGVIVRTGATGCVLARGDQITHIPAPPVVAVDTTGAGDAHSGVFLAGLAGGLAPVDAARRANAAAALSTTRPGPATSPARAELDAWLAARALPACLTLRAARAQRAGPAERPWQDRGVATILLLSTADTELLAARAAGAGYRTANPTRVPLDEPEALARLTGGADIVVLRLLGGRQAWPEGIAALRATGLPLVALGGESAPDAEIMALSTVPAGVAAEALGYLREGGPANLRELAAFLSDTVLLTGEGFAPPEPAPGYGVHALPEPAGPPADAPAHERPTVAVIFYRAHELSGNTGFIDTLCAAITERGGTPLPVYCSSLRSADPGLADLLRPASAIITTVLAAGGSAGADQGAEGDWDAGALAGLGVPLIQGLCLTSSRGPWQDAAGGLSPIDAAMQVAIPEFDGRLIAVPFSFKEEGPDGIPVYRADPERAGRLAGIAVRHARLAATPNPAKRVAIMLSSYPTKHSRVGNAVGLDTPASAVRLLQALREAGYDLGDGFPDDGDTLIHTLIAAGGYDTEWLTEQQLSAAPARVPLASYRRWFSSLPNAIQQKLTSHWGEPPGELYTDGDDIVLASLRFGNVVVMIQPPRGFGENPVAIYHDPELPPSHHYLAAYRWLDEEFGADAVIHLGKHGTLEWLPGKGLGLSAGCAPDAVLRDLPLIYPFIVNDPGEGTQAKRRAHAVIVDHLVPPMARADSYGELAKLEQLLDEYATVAALDPEKLPAVRAQIWSLTRAAHLHHDLEVSAEPGAAEFDDFVLHIDGYLCEVKDAAIRDGLHILGAAPVGDALVNLVLVILRSAQLWSARWGALPGLRAALGLAEGAGNASRSETDRYEQTGRALVEAMAATDWEPARAATVAATVLNAPPPPIVTGPVVPGPDPAAVARVLQFACTEVVPRLAATSGEIGAVLRALSGGYVPAGPSGSPTRGLVNVLPTGRNFYSVDPKAIPSANSWDTGTALAESLLARHLADEGSYPRCVGLTIWGTSAMRTQGDDIAEVLALIGCRPVWDEVSRRVTGFAIVPAEELGRPRIDVTVRISGFFRDAFPHVIALLDDAMAAVAGLDEPPELNYLRAHAVADHAAHGDWRRATTRIFGSKPGAYGAGLLPLIDARNWRDDADLAEVYAVWGGYAYGRDLDGAPARPDMETAFARIAVAAKNADTREHDIADSDDYFQYHGGMVAMVRSLTGRSPAAYIGDSATPDAVKTRTLAEETRRVFRSRVVNPRWIAAMRRHGYKGAFELAATVDYLFGYDATANVVADWMYERLAAAYVFDPESRAFMEKSNPWALRGITERLLEAAQRGMWAEPDPKTLDQLRQVFLDLEGDLEAEG